MLHGRSLLVICFNYSSVDRSIPNPNLSPNLPLWYPEVRSLSVSLFSVLQVYMLYLLNIFTVYLNVVTELFLHKLYFRHPIWVIASWVRQIMIVSAEKGSPFVYANSDLLHCSAIFPTNILCTVKILTWTLSIFSWEVQFGKKFNIFKQIESTCFPFYILFYRQILGFWYCKICEMQKHDTFQGNWMLQLLPKIVNVRW